PIALVSLNRLYGVDKEAILLPYLASFPSVPIITGVNLRSYQIGETIASPELCQTIEFLQQTNRLAPSLLNEISELKLGNPLILCLVNGGIQVKLRRGDFPQQILCLEAVLKELRVCRLSPRYIDLRFEGKVVVGT
ncbi:MAG: cell division protein FtsQ, partial [Candidatus Latescibacteria bacterium]|nr:cell division protein FtsQ [Candidatus Latescibacterota bacterium]